MSDIFDPYPFESEDEDEIGELQLDSVDAFDDERITVGELVGEQASWRFGHVIVDEAQDLTPMQWRMVMRRVSAKSVTIVGDVAQRSNGGPAPWSSLLPPELADVARRDLTINYRSPAEIHRYAVSMLAEFAPDVAPARSIRTSGIEPKFVAVDAARIEAAALHEAEQLLGVVGGQVAILGPLEAETEVEHEDERLQRLRPSQAKGLEFDAVVLVEPTAILESPGGASLLYIALTRATQRLVVVHHGPLPVVLAG